MKQLQRCAFSLVLLAIVGLMLCFNWTIYAPSDLVHVNVSTYTNSLWLHVGKGDGITNTSSHGFKLAGESLMQLNNTNSTILLRDIHTQSVSPKRCAPSALEPSLPQRWNDSQEVRGYSAKHGDLHTTVANVSRGISNKHRNGDLKLVTHSEPRNTSYVLVLQFMEQLESALNDIYRLISVTSPWRMQLVEPFVTGFSFGLAKEGNHLRFSDLFNLTSVNQQIKRCLLLDYSPIISVEEYISKHPTDIKVLSFKRQELNKQECFDVAHTKLQEVTASLDSEGYMKFRDAVCVNSANMINFTSVLQSVIRVEPGETRMNPVLTVTIPSWNGIVAKPDRFFYWDPNYKHKTCPIHSLEPSNLVVKETACFIQGLYLKRPFLAIHLRLEKLLKYYKKETLECLQKLFQAAKVIRDKYVLGPGNMVAFTDYGEFGSMTCAKCQTKAKELQIAMQMKHLGIQVIEYLPSSPTLRQRVFIASVERDVLASSDFLLVLWFWVIPKGYC